MNVSGLENSINRYSKKRKSNDPMKSTSIKNGKKSLPQVFIDLNNHTKKSKLTLQDKQYRADNGLGGSISSFNEGIGLDKNKKIVRKDHILLKNLYNTQLLRKNDQNKNILNQYRDEIELLKMDNERLREQNEKLIANQEYLQRRLKEQKVQKSKEIDEMKIAQIALEDKLEKYQQKIKGLYQQLIKVKKQKYGIGKNQRGEYQQQIILTTLNSENNRVKTKGQLRSYREREYKDYNNFEIEVQKYKRLTSPSSHSRGKGDRNFNRWCQEQKENLRKYEEKGELAYYHGQKYRESGRNSMLQNMQD